MVLSNYKSMHIWIQNSEISIQGLQSYSSNVSSNRIKIQVILLILQLETDYFSSYSFQKCSIQSSGITVFTETSRTAYSTRRSPTGFFSSNSTRVPIHHPHTTYMCTLHYIQRILHPESNFTCRRQRALRVLLLVWIQNPKKKFYA